MNDQTPQLLSLCRRLVDPDAEPVTQHSGHNATTVLRAATRHGEVIAKIHRGADRHAQELHAYRHWTPALDGHAPRLLAACDDPPAIVITALDGQPLSDLDLGPASERQAHRQAGELLRRLHHAGPPRTEPDMTLWLSQRGEEWLRLAPAVLPSERIAEIRRHLNALAQLGPIPAVPCHLDYAPRNLLRSTEGIIGVIDFEHARHDLAARDLVRMSRHAWADRSDLKEAFLDGYGALSAIDRQVIDHCSHLDALTATVRGSGQVPSGANPVAGGKRARPPQGVDIRRTGRG